MGNGETSVQCQCSAVNPTAVMTELVETFTNSKFDYVFSQEVITSFAFIILGAKIIINIRIL